MSETELPIEVFEATLPDEDAVAMAKAVVASLSGEPAHATIAALLTRHNDGVRLEMRVHNANRREMAMAGVELLQLYVRELRGCTCGEDHGDQAREMQALVDLAMQLARLGACVAIH